jgi:hypothetical protein
MKRNLVCLASTEGGSSVVTGGDTYVLVYEKCDMDLIFTTAEKTIQR